MTINQFKLITITKTSINKMQHLIYNIFVCNKYYNIKDIYVKQRVPDFVFDSTHHLFNTVLGRTPACRYHQNRRPDLNPPKKYFYNCYIDLCKEYFLHIDHTQFGKIEPVPASRRPDELWGSNPVIDELIKERLYMKQRYYINTDEQNINIIYKSNLNMTEYIIVRDYINDICKIYDLYGEFVYVKAQPSGFHYKAIVTNETPVPQGRYIQWESISRYTNNIRISGTNPNKIIDCTSNLLLHINITCVSEHAY